MARIIKIRTFVHKNGEKQNICFVPPFLTPQQSAVVYDSFLCNCNRLQQQCSRLVEASGELLQGQSQCSVVQLYWQLPLTLQCSFTHNFYVVQQFRVVQCSSVQFSVIQCSAVHLCIVHCNAVQFGLMQGSAAELNLV